MASPQIWWHTTWNLCSPGLVLGHGPWISLGFRQASLACSSCGSKVRGGSYLHSTERKRILEVRFSCSWPDRLRDRYPHRTLHAMREHSRSAFYSDWSLEQISEPQSLLVQLKPSVKAWFSSTASGKNSRLVSWTDHTAPELVKNAGTKIRPKTRPQDTLFSLFSASAPPSFSRSSSCEADTELNLTIQTCQTTNNPIPRNIRVQDTTSNFDLDLRPEASYISSRHWTK